MFHLFFEELFRWDYFLIFLEKIKSLEAFATDKSQIMATNNCLQ